MKVTSVPLPRRKKQSYRSGLFFLVIILLFLLVVSFLVSQAIKQQSVRSFATTSPTCQGIYIPADFSNSGPEMTKTLAAGNAVSFIRANNGNGPGTSADPALVADIAKARANGTRVMGYVDTSFGARDPNAVKADIDTWKQLFNVTDIMFDNAYEQDRSKVAYYQDLTAYVHQTPGAIDKMNAGDIIPEAYLQAADNIGMFEGPYSNFVNFHVPAWVHNYPPTRFSAEVHSVPSTADIPNAMSLFQQNNIGYLMLTDSTNPWVGFSTDAFWNALVSAVKSDCTNTIAPSGITPSSSYPNPTFVCGGSPSSICSTGVPTPTTGSQPTITVWPTALPSLIPPSVSTHPSAPVQTGTPPQSDTLLQAIIAIFLQFVELLLKLLVHL